MSEPSTGQEETNGYGYTDEEHEQIVIRVNAGHVSDYDGSRRKYADSVSTSEALCKRAKASMNGHG